MRIPLCLSLLGLSLATVWADIDLSPNAASISVGGFALHRLQFTGDGKKFCMSLDSDAEVSATNGGSQVRFKNIPGASVSFVSSPLTPATPFEADGLVQYQRAAVKLLPSSAESVVQDSAGSFPESIDGGTSYQFVFSYSIAGSPMRESISFVNLGTKQQIVVKAGSYLKDFEAISTRGVNMIRDWHVLRPAEEEGLN